LVAGSIAPSACAASVRDFKDREGFSGMAASPKDGTACKISPP
jgi:hypothetical protein